MCSVHDETGLGTSLGVSFENNGLILLRTGGKLENLLVLETINQKSVF